jgi:hypothetical protein
MGFTGQVTGTVRQGTIGEVVIRIRGGTERFYAYPSEKDQVMIVGASVLVVEYRPPRTVYVVPWVAEPSEST